jgi:hypothetical protein
MYKSGIDQSWHEANKTEPNPCPEAYVERWSEYLNDYDLELPDGYEVVVDGPILEELDGNVEYEVRPSGKPQTQAGQKRKHSGTGSGVGLKSASSNQRRPFPLPWMKPRNRCDSSIAKI